MMVTKKKITISIDLDIYDKMRDWAEKEDRSFSQQASRVFKEALERRENESKE